MEKNGDGASRVLSRGEHHTVLADALTVMPDDRESTSAPWPALESCYDSLVNRLTRRIR